MNQIQQIRREDIELGDNVRRSMDDYETKCLAVSIRERGIEIPLELEPGTRKPYRLRDGFRRFAASVLLGLEYVPARVHGTGQSESERVEYQLTVNCHRSDISMLDRAIAVRRLLETTGRTAADTSRRLGMSNTAVSNLLSLLTLPDAIQQHLAAGKLAASTAFEIARIKDPAKQLELAGLAAAGQLKRDAVKTAARRRDGARAAAKPVRKQRVTMPLNGGCTVTVAGHELTLATLIASLDELGARARAASASGLEIESFIMSLKEQPNAQVTVG